MLGPSGGARASDAFLRVGFDCAALAASLPGPSDVAATGSTHVVSERATSLHGQETPSTEGTCDDSDETLLENQLDQLMGKIQKLAVVARQATGIGVSFEDSSPGSMFRDSLGSGSQQELVSARCSRVSRASVGRPWSPRNSVAVFRAIENLTESLRDERAFDVDLASNLAEAEQRIFDQQQEITSLKAQLEECASEISKLRNQDRSSIPRSLQGVVATVSADQQILAQQAEIANLQSQLDERTLEVASFRGCVRECVASLQDVPPEDACLLVGANDSSIQLYVASVPCKTKHEAPQLTRPVLQADAVLPRAALPSHFPKTLSRCTPVGGQVSERSVHTAVVSPAVHMGPGPSVQRRLLCQSGGELHRFLTRTYDDRVNQMLDLGPPYVKPLILSASASGLSPNDSLASRCSPRLLDTSRLAATFSTPRNSRSGSASALPRRIFRY